MVDPTSFLIAGLMAIGMGVSFFVADPRSPTSRPLALFWIATGCAYLANPLTPLATPDERLVLLRYFGFAEAVILLTGLEWVLRVLRTRSGAPVSRAGLVRVAQAGAVVYGIVSVAFPAFALAHWKTAWAPASLADPGFYVFALPFLGAIVLAAVPLFEARGGKLDPAELIRLNALLVAIPFWIASMTGPYAWKPIEFAIGEVIFLVGSIRYHVVQGQRGEFLARFVSPALARVVRERGLATAMQRTRLELSVVACDLRGFTAFSETGAPEDVMQLLAEYYAAATAAIAEYGGSVKDFAGDGILALVGAPVALPDHARRALEMGLAVRDSGEAVLARWRRLGLELGVGVGIASGFATVGAIGGTGRLEYGAVGPVVNLASRLASRAAAGEVLADARVVGLADGVRDLRLAVLEPAELKGFSRPVALYSVARSGGAQPQPTSQVAPRTAVPG